jgi:hypothetical protein
LLATPAPIVTRGSGLKRLNANTTGFSNTAVGEIALLDNLTGNLNTALGATALLHNQFGNGNTAIGSNALRNSTEDNNTAVGDNALQNLASGGSNTALRISAGSGVTTASSTICIGASGVNVSNTCFIGHIRNVTTGQNNALPVVVDSANQLGTMSSSRRYKKEIKPMERASEAILALKPVTLHYKSDETNRPEFGLIAEDVAEVNPDLVVRDENGEIYTVRYDAVNAMLLNEFLKAHKRMQKVEARDAKQQKQIETLTKQLNEQAAQIQKMSAQHELAEPAPQVATNNP